MVVELENGGVKSYVFPEAIWYLGYRLGGAVLQIKAIYIAKYITIFYILRFPNSYAKNKNSIQSENKGWS